MHRALRPFPSIRRRGWIASGAALVAGLGLSLLPGLCVSRGGPVTASPASGPAPVERAQSPVLALLPTDDGLPRSADGRHYPLLPPNANNLAALLASVEDALRDPATPENALSLLGHQQQVIYRVLAHRRSLADKVREALPARWQPVFDHHVAARREFLAMHKGKRSLTLPS
jgi:hypothetical protein